MKGILGFIKYYLPILAGIAIIVIRFAAESTTVAEEYDSFEFYAEINEVEEPEISTVNNKDGFDLHVSVSYEDVYEMVMGFDSRLDPFVEDFSTQINDKIEAFANAIYNKDTHILEEYLSWNLLIREAGDFGKALMLSHLFHTIDENWERLSEFQCEGNPRTGNIYRGIYPKRPKSYW